ncbi:uncharacterized protein LOC107885511 [Acyrthosiphon pisum]|uniref:Uncharacterized protein n=1 Tax=Acyrthosiphon pisum TaxID=7029 RepID=A0A8R2D792_ACYPI|nr:uncharacterized protein LOC107885511 [Acyrthosiphon pisum]|eukprot:XP_016664657.1 PREDICTED: uncharacterized protein LOC107885511 [Acyrthosiphon pisum]
MINLVYLLNALSIERAVIAFSDLNICVGGPKSTNIPGIKDNNAEPSSNKVWHQLDCPYIIPSGKKRSLNCEKLLGKFRLKKLKIISGKITKKYISPTLTPIRRKMYSDILLHKVTLAKTNKRYLLCIQNLHNKFSSSQNKIKEISTDSINNIISQ